jgi:hypothetical protein
LKLKISEKSLELSEKRLLPAAFRVGGDSHQDSRTGSE